MKKIFFGFFLFSTSLVVTAQETTTYQKPAQVISELLLTKPIPTVSIDKSGQWMVVTEKDAYPSIAELAAPEARIAGLRINISNFSLSRQSYINNITLKNIKSGKTHTIIGLPKNLNATGPYWSNDQSKFAFTQSNRYSIDLYIVDLKTAQAKKVNKKPLNTVMGNHIIWIDNQTIIYPTAIKSSVNAPKIPSQPLGPNIQENLGSIAPSRTNQDMLKTAYDEQLFEFLATVQFVKNHNGIETNISKPAIYSTFNLSPDKKYILSKEIQKPYSYLVGVYGFPSVVKILTNDGKTVKLITKLPSTEGSPLGRDNTQNVARAFNWRDDQAATLIWVKPLDSGLIKNKVPFRDEILSLEAPFNTEAKVLAKTESRFSGISWGNENFALIRESNSAKSITKINILNPSTGKTELLFETKNSDAYQQPGNPITVRNKFNRNVIYIYNNTLLLNNTTGSSPKGDLPFLARYNLNTKKSEIIWRCQEGSFEYVSQIINPDKLEIITRKESKTDVPNFYIKNLILKIADQQITHFINPYSALIGVSKQKISYLRADSIELTGDLYLPKGYNKEKDGPLPVLIWAYPREYTSASSAAQIRGSENKFTMLTYGSPVFYVTQGYAILDNAEMPIVAHKGKKPNDSFVEQLELNAKAAIIKLAEMGVGDSSRIAIGGHSYGAFMTANLLAHTKLFKAGIARSGAYNRTLTPFGFQNETRTYWQAPKLYYDMSPFSYADKIKTPLLLIHGEMDDNQGTFPINSDRLFNAIKGHGGTSRLVFLPYESHRYQARESLLHLAWETSKWLDTYVKPKH